MNRSFRAQDSQMQLATAAASKQRQQLRDSLIKDKEDGLALFLEMRRREKDQNNLLLNGNGDFDAPSVDQPGTSPMYNVSSAAPTRKSGAEEFLNSENDKNDYDWLLTPPGTPLFPSLEMESHKTIMSQIGSPKIRPTALRSRLSNPQTEHPSRGNTLSKESASIIGSQRPSSSGGRGSRPATPTGRPILPTTTKPSRSSTPTSRPTLPSSRQIVSGYNKSTTIASNRSLPAAKPVKPTAPARSTTPLSRSTSRSSTPISRPSMPPSKPTSRAPTPTRRPSTPSSAPIKSSPSVSKPVPSRGASPTIKPRPWKPSDMPGFSLDAPPNLRTSLPDRPLSASRGRPGAPSSRSSSIEPGPTVRPRRQSCSPSRGRAPNGIGYSSGTSVPAVSRHSKVSDNVSPVVIGTKMVERMMNMRKLVPPKHDDKHSPLSNLSGKSASSSSPDSLGIGRTLSKKSLDMAIRHMDIRRSIPSSLRPMMTSIPASSMYSVRSGPTRSRTVSVSDSPLATSSNASSEVSINNDRFLLDGIEVEDNISRERPGRTPVRGR